MFWVLRSLELLLSIVNYDKKLWFLVQKPFKAVALIRFRYNDVQLLRFLLENNLDFEISDLYQPEFDFEFVAKNMPTIASRWSKYSKHKESRKCISFRILVCF